MDIRETTHARIEAELASLDCVPAQPDPEPLDLEHHHRIAKDESQKIYFGDWLRKNEGDPAFVVSFVRSTTKTNNNCCLFLELLASTTSTLVVAHPREYFHW